MSLSDFRSWYRLFGVVAVGLLAVVWIASGVLTREPPAVEARRDTGPMTVAVETRRAEPVEQLLVLQGEVEPHQRIQVRAETAGQVDRWLVPLGAEVATGDVVARLRMDDREARKQEAVARLRDAQSERDATQRLVAQGAAPRIELDAREAAVAAARARLEAVELDIDNTSIRSPVEGIVNRRVAERGDFVSVGDPVAEVIDNVPLLGIVQVPQHQIARVEKGQSARVRFIDGREAEGRVTFVSSVAEPGTRTFRVEVEVANPDRELPSGISAGIEIPTREVVAHKVSPALVSLDDSGQIGVKTVDDDDRVEFHPVDVVRTATDGVWVTGLPANIRLITVGQGFVTAGQAVRPQPEDEKGSADGADGDQAE